MTHCFANGHVGAGIQSGHIHGISVTYFGEAIGEVGLVVAKEISIIAKPLVSPGC